MSDDNKCNYNGTYFKLAKHPFISPVICRFLGGGRFSFIFIIVILFRRPEKSWEKVAFQDNLINRLNIFVKTFVAIIVRSDKPSIFQVVPLLCDTGRYEVSHQ